MGSTAKERELAALHRPQRLGIIAAVIDRSCPAIAPAIASAIAPELISWQRADQG
jgi:hypothetical protein